MINGFLIEEIDIENKEIMKKVQDFLKQEALVINDQIDYCAVINDEKNHKISRSELNYPLKKCYLCSNSAKLCARTKNHPLDLLLSYINKVIIQIFDIK
ncbi:citrate lyase holo-[acyl-carrier protein] synthase [Spiroplasma attinicola]|uniref:citrate lyase holo-[acyl-carrier protein] synthase n=1 Tax=Spiroplasma attinicola TaxID=2904537 RepID=UPI002022DA52|nr:MULTISPECIES: citrate lyase holo-[acyl-carrier protein] synthase [unclassified Spiroplasma]